MKKQMKNNDNKSFLKIPADIYGEILGLVHGCDIEISWLGQLKPTDDGYIVTKIHVLKQECTSSETELDDDEIGVLDYECTDGKYKEYGDLMWWGHSHVDMPVFWSDTDDKAIRQLADNGCRVVATVFNRNMLMKTAYRQGASPDGYYPAVFKDDLITEIVTTPKAMKIIKSKVKKAKPVRDIIVPSYSQTDFIDTELNEGMSNHLLASSLVKLFAHKEFLPLSLANEVFESYVNDLEIFPETVEELSLYMNTEFDIDRGVK